MSTVQQRIADITSGFQENLPEICFKLGTGAIEAMTLVTGAGIIASPLIGAVTDATMSQVAQVTALLTTNFGATGLALMWLEKQFKKKEKMLHL